MFSRSTTGQPVSKRTTSSMKAVRPMNCPNVLGAITGGKLLNLDLLQIAVGTRPPSVHAGAPFDALVVLQNASNIDMDAVIRLFVPEMDLSGFSGRISTKLVRPVRIGLRPGEVGCANMPVLTTVQATPGQDYKLQLEIQVEHKQRGAVRIRDEQGGPPLDFDTLSEERQRDIHTLQGPNYAIEPVGKVTHDKATLEASFEILPPAISALPQDLRPAYITLWTLADSPDDTALVEKAQPVVAAILPRLTPASVFFPLLKATQPHFEAGRFRLWAGEAVAIAKLMAFVLAQGVTPAGEAEPAYPRWYTRLCRAVVQNPHAADSLEQLVAEQLYLDLAYDAVMVGFNLLADVASEQFGSQDEMVAYANQLVTALSGKGNSLDVVQVYLPLVLAGLLVNTRVTLPREQTRETVSLLANARDKRAAQQNGDNKFVFDLLDDLIERALEHF